MRRLLLVSILLLALTNAAKIAAAARPKRIELSGGGLETPVTIIRPADVDALILNLCTPRDAGPTADRPGAYQIEIDWSDNILWAGQIYPAVGGEPPAAFILDFQLRVRNESEPRFCDERVIGRPAAEVLEDHGVDLSRSVRGRSRFLSWPVAAGGAAIAAAAILGLLLLRAKRRKEDHLAHGRGVTENHEEPVDPHS